MSVQDFPVSTGVSLMSATPVVPSIQSLDSDKASDEDDKTSFSPLTLAIIRSRWLGGFATPCHRHGTTFIGVGDVI